MDPSGAEFSGESAARILAALDSLDFMSDLFAGDLGDLPTIADVARLSGYFPDRTAAQLLLTMLAGKELDLKPVTALFDLEITPGSIRWKPGQPAQAAGDAIDAGRIRPGDRITIGLQSEPRTTPAGRTVIARPTARGGFDVFEKDGTPATVAGGETGVIDFPQSNSQVEKSAEPFDLPIAATVDALADMMPEPAADPGGPDALGLADDPELADALASDPFATGPDGLITPEPPAAAAWSGQERRKEQMPDWFYNENRRLTPWSYENANKRPVPSTEPETAQDQDQAGNVDSSPKSVEARPGSATDAGGPIDDDPIASDNAIFGDALADDAESDVTGPRDDEAADGWRHAIGDIMGKLGHSKDVVDVRLKKFDESDQVEKRKMFDAAQDYFLQSLADWSNKILAGAAARGMTDVKAFGLFAGVPGESSVWTWEDCEKASRALDTVPEKTGV